MEIDLETQKSSPLLLHFTCPVVENMLYLVSSLLKPLLAAVLMIIQSGAAAQRSGPD